MTTILLAFLISMAVSLFLTPVARTLGMRLGAVDMPEERKVHRNPTARTGGIAIFAAFYAGVIVIAQVGTQVSEAIDFDGKMGWMIAGHLLVFGVGVWDDFKRLGPKTKFAFQVLGAVLAFAGGLRIQPSGWCQGIWCAALPVGLTVFWFLLIINAVNLIDGLDGLAGGISLFASLLMVLLSVIGHRYVPALLFACLAGAILGFLRYNFPPATIFMGDGGSYFIGYALAALSLMGSSKTQTGATLLIAVVALGVPVFETILSPIRRFLRGRRLFFPDKEHSHHRLIRMGFTARSAVLLMYGLSILLCLYALVMVYFYDKQASLVLVLVGSVAFVFVRKLGYFDYINGKNLVGWLRDVGDEAGLNPERRRFLDIQIDIQRAGLVQEMWKHVERALDWLAFDFAEMKVQPDGEPFPDERACGQTSGVERHNGLFQWSRQGFDRFHHLCEACLMKMELPLIDPMTQRNLGTLWLVKDLKTNPVSHYTLKRVEHLRRSIVSKLAGFSMIRNDETPTECWAQQLPADSKECPTSQLPKQTLQRILVIEDEAITATAYEEALRQSGYEVSMASNAQEAIRLTESLVFDLAVVDLRLPDQDGWSLVKTLREIQPDMKAIAVTGFATKDERTLAQQHGFIGYFTKPVRIEEIIKDSPHF